MEAVLAGARFVVCTDMDVDVLAGTVRQVRAATLEPVEIAVAGGIGLDDAKEFAQTGVDHILVRPLAGGGPRFRCALEPTRPVVRLVPEQRLTPA